MHTYRVTITSGSTSRHERVRAESRAQAMERVRLRRGEHVVNVMEV